MKYTRYVLAIALLAFAVQARAGWIDDTVQEVIDKVRDVWNTVMGDVKDTAADLKRQLTSLQQKGDTVKENVEDILDLIQHRRTPFLDFVNGPNGRCGQGSACMDFRLDLENFVLDMADLKTKFPQINKHGLGDGTIVADVIDHLPPLVLFGLYEVLNKIPEWQDTPQNLANLYDEIGDPDVFSEEPLGASTATAAASVRSIAVKASQGGGQANFGAPGTPLDTFCSKGKRLRADPARLNRVRMGWTWVANMLDGGGELVPDGITVVAVGEGGKYPIGLKGFVKLAGKVIESIFASVDAHRANIALCKQIETDVAQRTPLVEYRTAAGNKKAYWVVKAVMQNTIGFSPTVDALLNDAGNFYKSSLYQSAYNKICDAYAAIGNF
jgi:hypothetical protein